MRERTIRTGVLIAGIVMTGTVACAQMGRPAPSKPGDERQPAPAPAPAPGGSPTSESQAQRADGEFRTARDLLVALERAGDTMRTLEAPVVYDRRFKLQGDRHIRRGTLYFSNQLNNAGQRSRAFAIVFSSLQVAGRYEDDPQTWVFDGRWLVEMRPAQKQFVKREVSRPGQPFDPLKIGEGPMPIPIGQDANEILARYDAQLLPAREGLPESWGVPDWLLGTYQLLLTPRPGVNEDDEFRTIRLWYEKGTLLPRMAITVNRGGDESIVYLESPKANAPLPEGMLNVKEPPAGAGWQVQIEELPALEEMEIDAPSR
ncbi:MAG: hypothetical protein KF684_10510 [Phycisphaeraceae bacterium]|nr:hypothetical protein [Phycisphaeraceae bacterium]